MLSLITLIVLFSIAFYAISYSKFYAYITCPLFVMLTLSLYSLFGDFSSYQAFVIKRNEELRTEAFLKQFKTVDELIVQLKKTVDMHPQDSKGWYLLGRLYLSTDKLQQAEKAFRRAYQLAPKNKKIALAYLNSYRMSQDLVAKK